MQAGGLLRADSPAKPGSPAARGLTGGWLGDVRAALLSVLFPAGCRICEELLTAATRIPICNDCLGSVRQITGTVCEKCGKPVEEAEAPDLEMLVCPTCVNDEWGGYAFDRARSWAIYEGALVRANANGAITRRRSSPNRWPNFSGCRTNRCYSPESGRVPTSIC
jgi:hypothetical protein